MKDFIDTYWEKEALPTLIAFGAIPNVSPEFDPAWEANGHMQKAVDMLAAWAQTRPIQNMKVEVVSLPNLTPTIFIEIEGEKEGTLLMYGHYDKQPGMEGTWREGLGPWKPVREGNLLYGRGLADDGYAVFAALGAVEAVQQGGKHPRIIILIEGSEETGSPHLPAYLEHLKERIGTPDVVITLDADTRTPDALWFTESLRGLVNGVLTIETLATSLHSGMGTGMVPSATRILRLLIERIEDSRTGRIIHTPLNPPITEDMKTRCKDIADALGSDYVKAFKIPENLRMSGATIEETVQMNLWESGLEIVGLDGLPSVKDAGNVLTPRIAVKLSLRLAPSLDPHEAEKELRRVLETNPPYGATVTFTPDAAAGGWLSKPMSERTRKAATVAAEAVYGKPPKGSGVGASIPFIKMMTNAYPIADNLVIGVLEPTSHEHGPNENLNIRVTKNITEWVARFLAVW